MSTVTLPQAQATALVQALREAGFRPYQSFGSSTVTGPVDIVWTPDFSPEEQATVDTLMKLAVGSTLLSTADRAALEPRLVALRTFRQQSQSEFMAKTATQRDRESFDAATDLAAIVLRLLRD